jgi:hypothetical protein
LRRVFSEAGCWPVADLRRWLTRKGSFAIAKVNAINAAAVKAVRTVPRTVRRHFRYSESIMEIVKYNTRTQSFKTNVPPTKAFSISLVRLLGILVCKDRADHD